MIKVPEHYEIDDRYEETEKYITITLKMKINKEKAQKYIGRMIKKQENPIVTEMKKMESIIRKELKEGKREKTYYNEEIFKKKSRAGSPLLGAGTQNGKSSEST